MEPFHLVTSATIVALGRTAFFSSATAASYSFSHGLPSSATTSCWHHRVTATVSLEGASHAGTCRQYMLSHATPATRNTRDANNSHNTANATRCCNTGMENAGAERWCNAAESRGVNAGAERHTTDGWGERRPTPNPPTCERGTGGRPPCGASALLVQQPPPRNLSTTCLPWSNAAYSKMRGEGGEIM